MSAFTSVVLVSAVLAAVGFLFRVVFGFSAAADVSAAAFVFLETLLFFGFTSDGSAFFSFSGSAAACTFAAVSVTVSVFYGASFSETGGFSVFTSVSAAFAARFKLALPTAILHYLLG